MRKLLVALCFLAVVAVSALAAPLYADHSPAFKRTVIAPRYDPAKEVTMAGTIHEVVTKPDPCSILGAHLMVSTAAGIIDAQIGSFVLRGPQAFSPVAGQFINLVGVMATINHRKVFLTRTIKTENRTIEIRTARGFPMIPGARQRIARTAAPGGVQ